MKQSRHFFALAVAAALVACSTPLDEFQLTAVFERSATAAPIPVGGGGGSTGGGPGGGAGAGVGGGSGGGSHFASTLTLRDAAGRSEGVCPRLRQLQLAVNGGAASIAGSTDEACVVVQTGPYQSPEYREPCTCSQATWTGDTASYGAGPAVDLEHAPTAEDGQYRVAVRDGSAVVKVVFPEPRISWPALVGDGSVVQRTTERELTLPADFIAQCAEAMDWVLTLRVSSIRPPTAEYVDCGPGATCTKVNTLSAVRTQTSLRFTVPGEVPPSGTTPGAAISLTLACHPIVSECGFRGCSVSVSDSVTFPIQRLE